MNEDIAIKVENLTKIYKLYDNHADRIKEALHWRGAKYHKDFYALNNVSFEIKKGECVGIIGKNGSGKSTLLKIITGVLTQSSGNITVNGKVSALLELGAGFNPEYTGMENIYFQGSLMGYTKEQMNERVQKIIDFADIGDFSHQPVKNYSSGMFARLAFAVAINVEPDILIVDEALAVGDMVFQAKCMNRMVNMIKDGVTVLFVSHDINAVRSLCKKALYLECGNRKEYGDVMYVTNKYNETYLLTLNHILDEVSVLQNHSEDNFYSEFDIPIKVTLEKKELDSNLSQRFGEGGAEILNAIIMDDNFTITNNLIAKHNYYIQAAIKFDKNFDTFVFFAMLVSLDGIQQIGHVSSQDNIILPNVKAGDVVIITLQMNIPIKEGTYNLSLGVEYPSLYNHQHKSIDVVLNFNTLKVSFENQANVFHSMFYTNAKYSVVKLDRVNEDKANYI